MSNILTKFKVLRPADEFSQRKFIDWLKAGHTKANGSNGKKVERFSIKEDKIATRGVFVKDFTHQNWDQMKLFNLNKNKLGASLKERSLCYKEIANDLFNQVYASSSEAPNQLIHVTCTGYVSPSAAQTVLAKKNWQQNTAVIHAYHMGCYASIPAVKIANGLTLKDKTVDIVHTEICSLHIDLSVDSPLQIIIQTLFADGCIKYSCESKDKFASHNEPGLEILAIREEIIPKTEKSMSWALGDHSFEMVLSQDVPKQIYKELKPYLTRLFKEAGLPYQRDAIFAIHPGGPKIIETIQETLELEERQIFDSKKILKKYGNMSSATLPHVWDSILNNNQIKSGELIVNLAFGPGLTIAGSLTRKII